MCNDKTSDHNTIIKRTCIFKVHLSVKFPRDLIMKKNDLKWLIGLTFD